MRHDVKFHEYRCLQGVERRLGAKIGGFMGSEKERLSLRVSPVTSYRLHTAYRKSGCRSMNELAEKAIGFYLDYLEADNAGDFLPTALKSYVDGRLGKLEDSLSSLSFRQSVEVDMMAGILADGFRLREEDLRRRRAESVNNVKRTNGRISLEKYVREGWEDEDEWQD